ncbi:hypothetical protein SAPIO_CDS4171 [Scedosporium apiospermum]|uniref:Oxidase ustYa n=1 Tax=Pseudallescheria apiosperma TaxID=563466 RepID=A0A084G9F2_PSEDA|nr:uncharacterized protein SAPIO_CDS4171 [Scedosporium apiospermum]KEZ43964.1 hypothetical protein SAPIO_CDS4171 [Scedosporium apiospermum]
MISELQSTADLGKNGQDEEKEAFLSVPLTNDHVPPSTKEAARRSAIRTLHNWIELSSDSRGYVQFQDADSYDLPNPYITPVNRTSDGPGYMVSLYHQLHCLSYLVEHFQAGYSGVELTDEIAHHSSHCFDYLRQAIMCAADTTLEGDTEYGPGWGSKHECKDYDAVLKWANEHATMRWRTNMPDESTL